MKYIYIWFLFVILKNIINMREKIETTEFSGT